MDVIQEVSGGQRLCWFLTAHWRGVTFVLTPLLAALIFLSYSSPIPKYVICGYVLIVMAVYWVTEAIPLTCTSVIPIFAFPLFGIMSTAETCFAYITDTVIMVLVSLVLAFCFEASGLHTRMALGIVKVVGYTHSRLIFGLSFFTMFISMWVTNMATTTMMLPINTAILEVLEKQKLGKIYEEVNGEQVPTQTAACYYLLSAYSSTIGGMGTLVGTGTNLAFKGLFEAAYPAAPELLSFTLFSMFTIPVMLVLNLACYFYMNFYYMGMFRPDSARSKELVITPAGKAAAKANVEEQSKNLGRITYYETIAGTLFLAAMVLFVTRSPSVFRGWADEITDLMVPESEKTGKKFIKDSAAGVFISVLMFILPSSLLLFSYLKAQPRKDLPTGPIPGLLVWGDYEMRLPWEFLLLVGGGFALSTGSKVSGLSTKIGEFLQILQPLPPSLVLLLVIGFTVILTNFCSNIAIANITVPIAMELAKSIGMSPLLLCTAAGLASSFAYCLPIGTPANALVQAKCNIPTAEMLKCGAGLSLVTIIIMWAFMSTYIYMVWEVDTSPEWAA